jgi:hypothetical protein
VKLSSDSGENEDVSDEQQVSFSIFISDEERSDFSKIAFVWSSSLTLKFSNFKKIINKNYDDNNKKLPL